MFARPFPAFTAAACVCAERCIWLSFSLRSRFPGLRLRNPRPPRERAQVWGSFQTLKINEKRLVFLLQQWVCVLKSKVLNYLMKAMPVLRRLRQCNPPGEVLMADTPRPRAAEGQALERVRGPARPTTVCVPWAVPVSARGTGKCLPRFVRVSPGTRAAHGGVHELRTRCGAGTGGHARRCNGSARSRTPPRSKGDRPS